jgi:AcrR family transcriptional regulator
MPAPAPEFRVTPQQRRSVERVDAILDAAAAMLEERGIAELTTTDVAQRAGTSIGGLYRYFPDVESLLQALAARNRERFWAHALAEDTGLKGREFVEHLTSSYVRFARSEPGFRALRFGHVLEDYLGEHSATSAMSETMLAALAERGGLVVTDELRLDVDVAMTISAALMQRAFELDPRGDQRVIDRATELASQIFARHVR